MKPEHDEIIEAMADAMWNPKLANKEKIEVALRAAAERGYVLAKLPERDSYPTHGWSDGWNDCLDAIETIEMDKEQDDAL